MQVCRTDDPIQSERPSVRLISQAPRLPCSTDREHGRTEAISEACEENETRCGPNSERRRAAHQRRDERPGYNSHAPRFRKRAAEVNVVGFKRDPLRASDADHATDQRHVAIE